jgi:DNA helicase HerA-like ATPase
MRPPAIPIATHDPKVPRATVHVRPDDLLRSVYVVGKTGTGKSTLLEHLLLGAVETGFGACLIDPHGDLCQAVAAHLPGRHWHRVVVLSPRDAVHAVGLRLLEQTPALSRDLLASGLVQVFRKLWGPILFGPRSEHLLRNAVLVLLENPGTTLLSLLRLLVDSSFRMRLLRRVHDPVVRTFWLKEFPMFSKQFEGEVLAPVLNKLGALAAPSVRRVVAQVHPRVSMQDVVEKGRVLLVDLSGIGRDAAELLGALIVASVGLAAFARVHQPRAERRPFLLVADEFQSYTTLAFAELLAQGRKFGLCAALAHQHLAQLEPEIRAAVLGNTGTIAAFNLSADDADALAPEFEPYLESRDLVTLKRHHVALRLLNRGEPGRPFVARTLAPQQGSEVVPGSLLRLCSERWSRPASLVDREITESLGMASPPPDDRRHP